MSTPIRIPEALSSLSGLGALKQAYAPQKSVALVLPVVGCLLVLSALGFSIAAGLADSLPAKASEARTLSDEVGALAFFAGLQALFGGLMLAAFFANRGKALGIYEEGFAWKAGKRLAPCRWEEVATFTQSVMRLYVNGIYAGTTHRYTVVKRDGATLLLSGKIKQFEDGALAIRQAIFPSLYQSDSTAFDGGQVLSFGPVAISKREGLRIGKKSCPWSELIQASLIEGFLRVTRKGGNVFTNPRVPLSRIPNFDVLMAIVKQTLVTASN